MVQSARTFRVSGDVGPQAQSDQPYTQLISFHLASVDARIMPFGSVFAVRLGSSEFSLSHTCTSGTMLMGLKPNPHDPIFPQCFSTVGWVI